MTGVSERQTFAHFEYETEPDDGFFVDSGEQWSGVRVRYRVPPARRWEKFIVVHETTDAQVRMAIVAHSSSSRPNQPIPRTRGGKPGEDQ